MPMGLFYAPATFQSLINSTFGVGIDLLMVLYLDDLLIYSNSFDEHLKHLELVFSRLSNI